MTHLPADAADAALLVARSPALARLSPSTSVAAVGLALGRLCALAGIPVADVTAFVQLGYRESRAVARG
jgi:hypothetical protein